jgi:hypothetical protein
MAEISDAELAEFQQLKAIRQAQVNAAAGGGGAGEVAPELLVRSRALLGDGTTHDYIGAHPTHVDNGHGPIPVMGVYNL